MPSAATIQKRLTIESLTHFCASIHTVLENHGESGKIFCLWGHFYVNREEINGGVRFTLPDCPNAMASTVTTGYPPSPDQVVIHCTISRIEHDPDFIETIHTFVEDWKSGIENGL